MTFDPFELVDVGRTGVRLTRLALGTATLGGLFREVPEADAIATARRAVDLGIRYFDTAPLYGYGNAEHRLGMALRNVPTDSYVLSSKVGRLLVDRDRITAGMEVDHQRAEGRDDYYFRDTPPVRPVFDYSSDGVIRSVEESLERLGLDRIDILYIHDPDGHWEQAISGAYPALARLRAEGTVRAIGVGMNDADMLVRFAREGDFDIFLVANRYTLLGQEALDELFPLCLERGIAVALGGVFNSGILANPRPGSRFGYVPADPAILARAERLRDICARHGVPLAAAAIQFALAHPAVVSIVTGVRSITQLDEYPGLVRHEIPDQLWQELIAEQLLPPGVPTPNPTVLHAGDASQSQGA